MNKAKPRNSDDDDEEEEIDSDDANDVYEYEEAIPEEESGKNRRYDPVENFEYDQFRACCGFYLGDVESDQAPLVHVINCRPFGDGKGNIEIV